MEPGHIMKGEVIRYKSLAHVIIKAEKFQSVIFVF